MANSAATKNPFRATKNMVSKISNTIRQNKRAAVNSPYESIYFLKFKFSFPGRQFFPGLQSYQVIGPSYKVQQPLSTFLSSSWVQVWSYSLPLQLLVLA